MIDIPAEKNTLYEILLTTTNKDQSYNTKPFGITITDEDKIHITIFPNRTLKNIQRNPEILIQFTQDALTYTKSALSKLESDDYIDSDMKILKKTDYVIKAKVVDIKEEQIHDQFSRTMKAQIMCEIEDIQKLHDKIPTLSRPTAQIIEHLVKYSRVKFMNIDEKKAFLSEIDESASLINRQGNEDHKEALKLIHDALESRI
ncbi:DUF447 domain-containing protein [Methanosphaera cuniculi]|uniref:DUF447 family protein n=1 Tax=Methanosphaera cuniculi TaxID=1077256 RepID=A0A2A2HCV3_9EURY|nr:DUF447 domain-containing protein [Methanosphaera cuniculi]PAV07205.1 hypothetical protein ASJ82_05910 [Methanosphaera cuniculi]PWL08514.1 hypothetical protein MSCUN_05930 [Methanosphaera cuniculi]